VSVYVDCSAFYAILDLDDKEHIRAKESWTSLVQAGETMVTSNYVVAETFALVQHRLGIPAVRMLHEDLLALVQIEWVDEAYHQAGVAAVLAAGRRHLSFVDCVSFEVMRRLGIRTAFAFDHHFTEHGVRSIPQ